MSDDPELKLPPRPDPRALPNPGGVRVYGENAIAKPHRPLTLTTKQRQTPEAIPSRAPFLPGVTQLLPDQVIEGELPAEAQVQALELMLENPDLEEATRAAIMAAIARLTEGT